MEVNAVATLPTVSNARLPATYEHAKTALAECSRVDECKDWADKAAALASYAKQAKDEQLQKYAERIRARAIRRCGELLKQVEPSKGGQPTHDGGGISRTKAAADAGLSERQKVTALRVASIPDADFDSQVESDDPPTVSRLAEQGKKSLIDLGSTSPDDFKMATAALASLRRFSEFTNTHDPRRVAAGVRPQEIESARRHVAAIDHWLDVFITNIGG